MRRMVRGFLWVVKGVLLVVALAALFLWLWGHINDALLQADRSTRAEYLKLGISWGYGRIGMDISRFKYKGADQASATRQPSGWQINYIDHYSGPATSNTSHSLGPIRWQTHGHYSRSLYSSSLYALVSFPCWLLFLVAGAWPLASLTLLLRRRARLLRLTRAGCCAQCGYDLRATPHSGGELLIRCPECGTPSARQTTT